MAAPIPSFFKIRCWLVVIAFLLFFMFLGMLKNVRSQSLYDCTADGSNDCYDTHWSVTYKVYSTLEEAAAAYAEGPGDPYEYNGPRTADRWYTSPDGAGLGPITIFTRHVGYLCDDLYVYAVCPNCAQEKTDLTEKCGASNYTLNLDNCEGGCTNSCTEQRAQLSDICGGDDKYVIDEDTCEGACLCTDESAAYSSQCGSGNVVWTDRDNCEAHCQDCVDEAAQQCGGSANVEWNQDGDCSYECKRPCEDEADHLAWQCGGTDSYWIDNKTCKGCCITDENHDCDGTSDDKDNDDDNDGIPDADDPCPKNPDPNCKPADTDGDGIPDSEDDDDDGDVILDDEDPDDDGDGVPDSQDLDHDADGDGIPDWKDPDFDWDGDGIPNGEDDDDDGDGDPDNQDPTTEDANINDYRLKESPYSVGQDTLSQQFSGRWGQFVGDIKQTSFFSIPEQVFGGFDSGSEESSLTIDGGETFGGEHSVEFSSWTPGLAALRGVLYACFCVIAVRIVTLKR